MAPRRPSRKASPAPKASAAPSATLRPDRPWLLYVVLLLVTLAAYLPALHGGVLWDDDAHLTAAPLMSWQGLGRIWTDFRVTQQYYPVVNTAFWVMNEAWGRNTLGYHFVNIALHALSACLIAGILRRWSVPGAVIAATIFALHPLQVESVAWMSELKNTMSGVFYLLSAIAYLRFDRTRERWSYATALILFVLALGSKTVTATLPAALLIVFWWQRGRIDWRKDVLPLVPMFGLGLAAGLGTAFLEVTWVGAKGGEFTLTFVERILLAGRAVWFYAGKVLWPFNFMFMFPRWTIDQSVAWQYLFPIALIAVLGTLWAIRGRTRGPLAAALYFCGTLFPALGFFNVYPFRYSFVASHFAYLASLGLIVLLSAGLAMLLTRWRPSVSESTIAVVVAVPLFILSFQESRQYASEEALWRATMAVNPTSVLARNNLAALLLNGPSEHWAEAADLAREALRIKPDDSSSHNNLGVFLQRSGKYTESVAEHREAIRLKPDGPELYYNLGIALGSQGDFQGAVAAYEKSLQIQPEQPDALHNLGKALGELKRYPESVDRLREAARLAPNNKAILLSLGNAFQLNHDYDNAIATYQKALKLYPDWGEAQHNLALAYRGAGRLDEAVAAFLEAERLLPDSARVELNLATLLVSMQRVNDSIPHFEHALKTVDSSQLPDVHNNLGIVLAMTGRLDLAIPHFEEAIRLRPDYEQAKANLARARRGGR